MRGFFSTWITSWMSLMLPIFMRWILDTWARFFHLSHVFHMNHVLSLISLITSPWFTLSSQLIHAAEDVHNCVPMNVDAKSQRSFADVQPQRTWSSVSSCPRRWQWYPIDNPLGEENLLLGVPYVESSTHNVWFYDLPELFKVFECSYHGYNFSS